MHLISTLSYEQDTFQASVGKVNSPISTSEGSKPVKPKSNSKPRRVWRKKLTSPLEVSSQESSYLEQTEVLDQ
jgi:hypothetical protein